MLIARELNPLQIPAPLSYGQFEVSRTGSRSAGVASQELMNATIAGKRQDAAKRGKQQSSDVGRSGWRQRCAAQINSSKT